MTGRRRAGLVLLALLAGCTREPAPASTGRVLDAAARRAILDKTVTIKLDPDLSWLTAEEREAVGHLLRAGQILQGLYELANHRQAPETRRRIAAMTGRDGAGDGELADLYRLNEGPVATTLENDRLPILPGVDTLAAGRNVYPWGVKQAEIEAWLTAHPEERDAILDPRTAVRRATAEALRADLATIGRHPALRALHPSLEPALRSRARARRIRPGSTPCPTRWPGPTRCSGSRNCSTAPPTPSRAAIPSSPATSGSAPATCSPTTTRAATPPGSPATSPG